MPTPNLRAALRTADLRELADRLDAPIGLLERGRDGDAAGWTSRLVDRVALALGMDPAAAWADESLDVDGVLTSLDPDLAAICRRALARAAAMTAMTELLGRSPGWRAHGAGPGEEGPGEDGAALARELRRAIGRVERPIRVLRDLMGDALGVRVERHPLPTGVRGVALASPRGRAVLHTTRDDAAIERYDLAVLLAHALYDEGSTVSADVEPGQALDPDSERADAFATELLVPEAGLVEMLGPPGDEALAPSAVLPALRKVAAWFDAPYTAVLAQLRPWTDPADDAQLAALSAAIEPKPEQYAARHRGPPPRHDWLAVRVEEARRAGRVSARRAVELLGVGG